MDARADLPEPDRNAKRYRCIQWVNRAVVLLLIAILCLLPLRVATWILRRV